MWAEAGGQTAGAAEAPTTTPESAAPTDPSPSGSDTPAVADCERVEPLHVAAAAAVVPLLEGLADQACVDLTVDVTDGVTGAAELHAGEIDAWVADSREYGLAAGLEAAAAAPSTAWSPVVLAAAPATASAIDPAALSWASLIQSPGQLAGRPVSVAEDASGIQVSVTSLFSGIAASATGDTTAAVAVAGNALAHLGRFSAAEGSSAVGPDTLRITEARNVVAGDAILAPAPGVPVLEYPWLGDTASPAAARLLAALGTPEATALRADLGLIDPNQSSYTLPSGAQVAAIPATDLSRARTAFVLAGQGNLPAHTLAIVDVSGSMSAPTPEGTLLDTVKQGFTVVLSTLAAETSIGIWQFSYDPDGGAHHREVTPFMLVGDGRDTMLGAAATVQVDEDGGTALYTTVVDAVRTVRDQWKPDYVNKVLLFTDGRNEDAPGTLDLANALATLTAEADPEHPVSLVMFAAGDADVPALQQLVAANDGEGGVYPISSPAQVVGAITTSIGDELVFP